MVANPKLAETRSDDPQWDDPWRGFAPGTWQSRVNVREFIQRNYTPYEGDGKFLQGPTERTRGLWQKLLPLLAQEREKGVLDVSQMPSGILAHAPGYIDKDREIIVGLQTDAPLKRAIMPFGGWRVVEASLKAYGYEPDAASRGDLHQVPQDAQRRRVRCLHARDQEGPSFARRHRPAGCLRPRPHHRRLPPRGALRRGLSRRRQGAREARARRPSLDRGHHPPARGAVRADPVAEGAEGDGVALRLRHLRPGAQRPRSGAVDLLRLSRGDQAAERRGDVGGPPVDVLGHLLRARSARRHADRVPGPGNHRRPGDQVAHRALPARARVQPALLRRPGMGDRGAGRNGRGRAHAGDQDLVPHAAHPLQPRARAGAQPHRVLVAATARRLQALRDQDLDRHQRDPVRVRRPDAAQVGRRLRHRLLRLGDARRQADAVLRRAREPARRRCSTP